MKEHAGVGEGASPEQLKKQRARVIKAGALTGLLGAALALAANMFFVEVQEYKQLKGTLTIEVDRGSDGTVDERREIEDSNVKQAWVEQTEQVSLARYLVDHIGPSPAYALIVNTGENWLVDAFQNLVEPETMIYHGSGTGTAAAAEGDISLGTEITTGLNPDNTRPSCSVVGEGASANIRRCQATVTYDATLAVTEWGLFNQAATGGGTMFSRVVFNAVNVNSGDSIQFTYDLTVE